MTSTNVQGSNKKYIFLNNFGRKQSVNEIWPVYAIKKFIKIFQESYDLKTSSRHILVCKELNTTSLGKSNF